MRTSAVRAASKPKTKAKPKVKPKTVARWYTLDERQLQALKNEILIVLADYQTLKPCPSCDNGRDFAINERVRVEVADRILDNLRLIGR